MSAALKAAEISAIRDSAQSLTLENASRASLTLALSYSERERNQSILAYQTTSRAIFDVAELLVLVGFNLAVLDGSAPMLD